MYELEVVPAGFEASYVRFCNKTLLIRIFLYPRPYRHVN